MDKIVLSDLKDVSNTAPGDGDVLEWSAAQGKWVPGPGGGGVIPTLQQVMDQGADYTGTNNFSMASAASYVTDQGFNLGLGNASGALSSASVYAAQSLQHLSTGTSGTAELTLDANGSVDLNWKSGSNASGFTIDGTQMLVTDANNTKGLEYALDYSGSFTTNSLVSKFYVDTQIANIPAGVTSVSTTDSFVTITNPTTTPSISIGEASGTATGVLSSTDWNTFNNKTAFAEPAIFSGGGTPTLASGVTDLEIRTLIGAGVGNGVVTSITTSGTSGAATLNSGVLNIPNYTTSGGSGTVTEVTTSAPLTVTNGTTTPALNITQSNTTTDGYLSSTDWNTFNNKSDFSGAYADLTGTPTIPTNNNELINGEGFITSSSTDTLTNKSGSNSQWTNDEGYITAASLPTVNDGTLTITVDGTATTFTANQSGNSSVSITTGGGGSGNASETIDYYQISNSSDTKPFHTDTYITLGWDETGNDLELTMLTAPSSGGIYSLVTKSANSGSTQTFISVTNATYDIFPSGIGAGYRGTVTITAEDDVNYPFYQVEGENPSESAKISVCVRAIQK
jgi:hypothetical protein